MLEVDRFRPVNKLANMVMIVFGVVLGFAIPTLTARFLSMVALLAAALTIGGLAALLINAVYRVAFRDGVPIPERPEYISPGCYGRVAWRHFAKFAKALVSSFALTLVVLAIYRAI